MHIASCQIARKLALALLAATVFAATGCATKRQVRPAGIQTKARQGYLNGLIELEAGNYQEAIRRFQEVASSPRYFRYTALAALRVADALFYQEQYTRAIEAYQGFIKQFAGNPNTPYAEFRVAECHFERIPGDWVLLPPAYEKDLATTRSAYDALTRFLNRHPRHRFAVQAKRMRAYCATRLLEHELYVADFYEGRDSPMGVAQRLEAALREFPEAALTESNLLWLARSYREAGDPAGEQSALERYVTAFPGGDDSDEVKARLDALTISPQVQDSPSPDDREEP